jgi:Family of unknown function (DUF5996)
MTASPTEDHAWPALDFNEWAATKRTLQMITQMLGKAKLAMSPPQPEWLHTRLFLDGRGLATGPMPYGPSTVSMGIDLYGPELWMVRDGRSVAMPLESDSCVSALWSDFRSALQELGLELDLWDKPQEIPDAPDFAENVRDCTLVGEHLLRFHRVLSAVHGVLEEFRSPFFGRSGVQFWWGGFDLTVLLFSGRKVEPPTDRGYIMRYDLDAEHLNAGFWPGDDSSPRAIFYGYLVPRPTGCEAAQIEPPQAGWVEEMGMWALPYDAVRESPDPRRTLLDFLESLYSLASDLGGWDRSAHEYERPTPQTHTHHAR